MDSLPFLFRILVMTILASPMTSAKSCILDPPTSNLEVVLAAFDNWANGTGGPYELLADDAIWTITGHSLASRTYTGREDFMSRVIRPFNARMKTPLRPTVRSAHTDGDKVILLFDAQGTARDGLPYVNTYAWFLDMRDGKIVRAQAFFDSIAFDALWTRVKPIESEGRLSRE